MSLPTPSQRPQQHPSARDETTLGVSTESVTRLFLKLKSIRLLRMYTL